MREPGIQRFYRSVEWSWLLELREAERRDGGGDADTIATRLDPDHTRAALHLNRWLRWRGTEDEGQVDLGIQRIDLVGEEIHAAGAHVAGEAGSARELHRQRKHIAPGAPGRLLLGFLDGESLTGRLWRLALTRHARTQRASSLTLGRLPVMRIPIL